MTEQTIAQLISPLTLDEMKSLLVSIQAATDHTTKLAYFQKVHQKMVSNIADNNHYTLMTLYNACQVLHETSPTTEKLQRFLELLHKKQHNLDMSVMTTILDSFCN